MVNICDLFSLLGPTPQDFVTPDTFATKDMTGKALSKATFRNIPANDVIACFKVMPRSQVTQIRKKKKKKKKKKKH